MNGRNDCENMLLFVFNSSLVHGLVPKRCIVCFIQTQDRRKLVIVSGKVDVIMLLASASDTFLIVFLAIVFSWKRMLNIIKCEGWCARAVKLTYKLAIYYIHVRINILDST